MGLLCRIFYFKFAQSCHTLDINGGRGCQVGSIEGGSGMLFCASEAEGHGADFDGVKGTPVHADRTRLMVWSKVIEVAPIGGSWLAASGGSSHPKVGAHDKNEGRGAWGVREEGEI